MIGQGRTGTRTSARPERNLQPKKDSHRKSEHLLGFVYFPSEPFAPDADFSLGSMYSFVGKCLITRGKSHHL